MRELSEDIHIVGILVACIHKRQISYVDKISSLVVVAHVND